MTRWRGKGPAQMTWVICLVLYLIALLAYFGALHIRADIALWSWVIGYGLLLISVRARGL